MMSILVERPSTGRDGIEKREGMFLLQDGELAWQEPESENVDIEHPVQRASDGRFAPALNVELIALDA